MHFRQVTPSEDNAAARSLSEVNQRHNMKLVALNARVTFVVWILETIANISVLTLWMFVYGATSFGTLTNSMMWYYLIISYTFLMNTSYNKDRIIEDGWKIVIMNSLMSIIYRIRKINSYFLSQSQQTDVQNSTQNETQKRQDYKNNLDDVPSNSTSNDPRTGSTASSQNTKSDRSSKPDIFVISRPEIEHFPTSHTSNFVDLTIEDLEKSIFARERKQAPLKNELRQLSTGSSTDSEYKPDGCNQLSCTERERNFVGDAEAIR